MSPLSGIQISYAVLDDLLQVARITRGQITLLRWALDVRDAVEPSVRAANMSADTGHQQRWPSLLARWVGYARGSAHTNCSHLLVCVMATVPTAGPTWLLGRTYP